MAVGIIYGPWASGGVPPHGALEEIQPPTEEPIALPEAKIILRLDADDATEDAIVAAQITAARQQVETETSSFLAQGIYRYWRDGIPCSGVLLLPRAPVLAIASVTVYAQDAPEVLLDPTTYRLDGASNPPRVIVLSGPTGSSSARLLQTIAIQFTGGPAVAPAWAVQAIRLLLEYWRVPTAGPETLEAYQDLIRSHYRPGVA